MKIEKSLTLSQFIDKIAFGATGEYTGIDFVNVMLYNDFLKQPLKKEMFINEASKDWFNKDKSIKIEVQLKYFEAEKKVIFKGFNSTVYIQHVKEPMPEYEYSNGKWTIQFYNHEGLNAIWLNNGDKDHLVKTTGDIFTATNGELNLQNVNI